jgi:predicted permease
LWERLWAGRPEAIGQRVRIDGESFTVVGVMPPDFIFIDSRVQAWLPLAFTNRQKTMRYSNNWAYLGRLKPGATVAQAQAQIDALNAANLERFPETKAVLASTGFHTVATRLQDDLVRDVRSTLYLLWGGAICVVLIGGVNVASLVLVRSRGRLKEIATRMALGAGRAQISRQLVTEHLLVTLGSALCGLLLGYAALQVLGAVTLENLPRGAEIALDGRVVVTTMLIAGVLGIVLGTIPVLGSLPLSLTTMLRDESRSDTSGRGVRTMRRSLLVVQIAAAFVLLIGAGLLLTSFRSVLAVDPGFRPEGVLTASVNLPEARYMDNNAVRRFTDVVLQQLRSLPGVTAAGVTTSIPYGTEFSQDVMLPEGYTMGPDASLLAAYYSVVTPGYFEAMGVR